MSMFFFWATVGFISAVLYASLFEWTLHKYFMHRPVGKFDYAFKAHALVHHQHFKSDHTYHLQPENQKYKNLIPMAWWNGPVLIAVGCIPYATLSLILGKWGLLIGGSVAIAAYYGAYEYMHWCMHLPKKRHIERSGIYFRLNGHHLLHHRYMHKNYNVVCPLADLLLGTLLLRSKVHFKQAEGPAVPNVQPRIPKVKLPKFASIR